MVCFLVIDALVLEKPEDLALRIAVEYRWAAF